MVIVYLAIACGFGALVRYFFSHYNQASKLPLGTLIANLLGSTLNDELQRLLSDKEVFYSYLTLTYLGGLVAIFLGILL